MLAQTLNFEITSVFWLNSVCNDSQSFNSPAVCGLINQINQSMIINQYTWTTIIRISVKLTLIAVRLVQWDECVNEIDSMR